MLDDGLEKPLYQAGNHPVDRALAQGAERVLARLPSRNATIADLTLTEVWVNSFSIAKMTDLKVQVVARFGFAAELRVEAAPEVRSTFVGEASGQFRQANARDHESTLNEAFCNALHDFRSWVGAR